jgi:NADPH:quinone reductase
MYDKILQAQGKHQSQPKMPFVLGAELAGRIARSSPIPEECPFKPGGTFPAIMYWCPDVTHTFLDRVFGSAQGAFAERVAVDWKQLHPIPSNMV